MATINSALLTRIVNNCQVHLPGAVEDVMKQELFNVCDEFFRTTNTWQEEVPFETVQDQVIYEVVPTVGWFVRLMWVTDGDGFQRGAWMTQDGWLQVRDMPTGGSRYTAALALTVVDPTKKDGWPEVVPTELLVKFYDVLVEGLLGRMMIQPSKPYSNDQLGVFHQRKFRNLMVIARVEQQHSSTYGAQNWRFPAWA